MIDFRDIPNKSKEDVVNIRVDITVDLPKEVADEMERLGICEFDRCLLDSDRRQLSATYSTAYRKGA